MISEFSELNKHFFGVDKIFLQRQTNKGKTVFTMQNPRPTDAFLLFVNTKGVCYQSGKEPLYIPQGALVYMPKNSRYMWENSQATENKPQENLLFEFVLKRNDIYREKNYKKTINNSKFPEEHIAFSDSVKIVSLKNFGLYKKIMEELLDAFESKDFSPLFMYYKVYEFFHILSNTCMAEKKNGADIHLIRDSIKYLEQSVPPFKSIKETAQKCNISMSYYERIFRNFAGVSPLEYRNIHRINKIKVFLQNPELTLEEIAKNMGFCDSGYLCRFFRKQTGLTPKEYKKSYIIQTKKKSETE